MKYDVFPNKKSAGGKLPSATWPPSGQLITGSDRHLSNQND